MNVAIALGLLYVVWGSTYLAIRVCVQTMPPFFMAAGRFALAGAILYGWLKARGAATPKFSHWRSALIIGALLLGGGNGLVVWAEQTVVSGLAALLVSSVPLWMALIDWIRPGGRAPRFQTTVGLVLGFIGLIVLVGVKDLHLSAGSSAGIFMLVLASLLWALGSVYAKKADLPASPFMSTAIEMICGSVVLLLMGVLAGEPQRLSFSTISSLAWIGFFYLVFIGALVGFSTYIWLLKNTPLAIASTYAYVNPVVAVFLGWLFAGEQFSARILLGGFFVLIAVALITLSSSKNSKGAAAPRH